MSDIRLKYAAFSDVGLVRSNNQDAGYASPHLIAVADGMGGAAAGDVASSVAISHLAQIDDSHAADDLLPLLRQAMTDAHDDMLARVAADPKLAGLGTTCIAILRSSNKLGMVHIGDSRAYLMRGGTMQQVTHDHTLVQYLVDRGQLTPEEAEHHPQRNVIMRALGDTPGQVELDESIREARPGDRWLLCSDGLFGVVANDTIRHAMATIEDLEELGEHLIELALAAGAPDNVTVVLADVVADSDGEHGPNQPVIVGSAALDYQRPTRGGTSAAARAALLGQGAAGNAGMAGIAGVAKTPNSAGSAAEGYGEGADNSAGYGAGEYAGGSAGSGVYGKDGATMAGAEEGAEEDATSRTRRFRLARFFAILAVLAILVGGIIGGYQWTQTRYYVAAESGKVWIYRGVPQVIGSLRLSSPVEETDINLADLAPIAQERLQHPITRDSLDGAREVVDNLRTQVREDKRNTTGTGPEASNPGTPAPAPSSAPASPAPPAPAPSPAAPAPGGE
ncbi:protein phosphatase [Actinobaculum suis]|uniref:Protein phosphatase n=1 Tax=Actinobaculum suis TaxID=1657 RepID=A0A7Z8Y7N5_9ACTO|nr:protein phosphatase 2C domain-containing protein [Actinobaculum suis]VDG75376.1 protein phosphatase [Actinobaculum suis]